MITHAPLPLTQQSCITADAVVVKENTTIEAKNPHAFRVKRLDLADASDLQLLLHTHQSNDPYQCSAAYFFVTGRKGLWLVTQNHLSLLILIHPNLEGRIQVFPPIIGKTENNDIDSSSDEIDEFVHQTCRYARQFLGATSVMYARVEQHPTEQLFDYVEETFDDWIYPVHILSTEKLVRQKGKEYRHFRKKRGLVYRRNNNNVVFEDLDIHVHYTAMTNMLHKCLPEGQHDFYFRLFAMLRQGFPCLKGRVIFAHGELCAFSIHECNGQIANSFAGVALTAKFPGSSQLVYEDKCRQLLSKGFSHVCIGGSETEGLDKYKRSLRPVKSVKLCSFVPKF